MNLVVSNKPKRKSIYGEPHPLRKFIVDPRDNDDFDEDRTDGFSISFSPFSGGVKVGKSPRKKTAMEIHREKWNNPEFKKRLFANKDTKVQIFEKAARKRYADRVNHMIKDFREGWNSRFGKPTFMDNHIIGIFKQDVKDPSKITDGDKKDIKLYREESAENRQKAYYIYDIQRNEKKK